MSSLRSEKERRVCGILCITFASLMFALLVLELMMTSQGGRYTLSIEFLEKSSMSYSGGFFMIYLILGGLGFFGTMGVIEQYGHSDSVITRGVRLASLGFFLMAYWMWGALFVVQHKLTMLTDRPTNPPEWLLQVFAASDSLFALSGWGRLGPAILLYGGMSLMFWRGARLLPRAAAVVFGLVAATHVVQLIYLAVHGVGEVAHSSLDAQDIADKVLWLGDIVGFVLAGAALITEKGVFVRSRRI